MFPFDDVIMVFAVVWNDVWQQNTKTSIMGIETTIRTGYMEHSKRKFSIRSYYKYDIQSISPNKREPF